MTRETPKTHTAVTHLLDRCQADPRLWHVMGDTQSFRMLCEAEAERLGVPVAEVIERRSKPCPGAQGDPPLVVALDEASYWAKRARRLGQQVGRDTEGVSRAADALERELAAEVAAVRATTPEG